MSDDAPRAGGETPSLDLEATLRVLRIVEYDLKHRDDAPAPNPTSNEIHAEYAETLAALRAALLARHRDGERERLPAPSEIADLPAMTPIANVIRRSAYYVLNYHGATFASEKDAAGVAGHIAVSVTMANGFEDALHTAMSAGPSPERAP